MRQQQAGGVGDGVSPGNVPVCYYGPGGRVPSSLERRARAAEVLLRCAACGLAVLAAALLGADRQTRVFFSIQKVARYTDMQSLVVNNGPSMQKYRGVFDGPKTSFYRKFLLRYFAYCDKIILLDIRRLLVIANGMAACYSLIQCARCLVMAYIVISAVAAAMEAALIGKYGQPEFQWMKTCHLYKRFCAQAGGGVACAIAASVNMVGVALISAFNLFRLYGNSNGGGKATTTTMAGGK
nr:plant integral membrane protein TIGR01569 containing protein, expressed [Oryza sativa Japonica Group]